ncbi:MAG: phosphatase PAP2 family protein [Tannerellaceae bacterium]|jgi:membrane-associated phospholipid phosphatase|nr:phosphatase PAP2 family protein [Tannerellaceae bacterium]
MKSFFVAIIFITSNIVVSQSQYRTTFSVKDSVIITVKQKDPFWKQTIAPAVFIGLSAVTWQADEDVRVIRNRYIPNFHNKLDNYMQYAPAVTAFTLNLSGVKGRNKLGRAAINWGGGMLIMGVLVNSIKYSARVMRPDGTSRSSFPSGHTATAFMNATFLHKEYAHVNPLYSILGYSMSSYTGISRSMNNRHWLSDILAGAGIGILSTELSYLIVDRFYKNKGDFFTSFDMKKELENPSFVSVKFGQSFYIDKLSSFGKLGLEGAIEGAYFFNRKWGIGAEVGFMHIPFEKETLDLLEWDGLPEDIMNPQMDIQSLGLSSLMVGGYYSKFVGKKFILQSKALAGIGVGIGGNIDILAEKKGNEERVEMDIPLMKYSINNTWIIGGGVSLTMMIAPTLGISLYADYKYTNPKAKISISNYYSDVKDKFLTDDHLPINALSGGLKVISFF